MKKIVKIMVQKTHSRIFNLLVDESEDALGLESKLNKILLNGHEDSFFFDEDARSVVFIKSDTLETFSYRDGITYGVHKIVTHPIDPEYGDVLKEVSENDLCEMNEQE